MSTKISSAGNTLSSAYSALMEMGYAVSVSTDGKSFRGQKAGCTLIADDPLTMLGLAKLYELRGENWRPTDAEVDDFIEFINAPKLV